MSNSSETQLLPCVEIATADQVDLSIIWLHGLGADGHDFAGLVPALALPCATRFVFPHAPVRPVTINGGMPMRAWYDILALERDAVEDETGIRASAAALGRLVDREVERGLDTERIVLAGFSQGGAIALHAGLRDPRRLGGVVALSTYLPLAAQFAAEASDTARQLAIWMGHGQYDPVLDISLALRSRDQLSQAGVSVHWHSYPIEHSVSPQEIADISLWLARFA